LATTAASTAIGAGLGAGTAAVTGGDVGKGALFGGLGGGLAGYGSAAAASKAAQAGAAGTTPAAGMGIMPMAPAAGAPGVIAPSAVGAATPGLTVPNAPAGLAGAGQAAGLGGLGAPAGTNSVLQAGQASAGPATFDTLNYLQNVPAQLKGPQTFGQRLSEGVGNAWDEATSPGSLGRAATAGAKYLGTSALVGSGMDPAQERLLQQQQAEIKRAQAANEQTNMYRTEQGLKTIRESDYYDPNYMGLQRARQEQLRGVRLKQAGVRGLTGPAAASEARRFDLGTSRATGSGYDQGYQSGVGARTATRAAGVSMLPTSYPQTDYNGINSSYANAELIRQRRQEDAGKFVGELFTDPKEEEDRKRRGV